LEDTIRTTFGDLVECYDILDGLSQGISCSLTQGMYVENKMSFFSPDLLVVPSIVSSVSRKTPQNSQISPGRISIEVMLGREFAKKGVHGELVCWLVDRPVCLSYLACPIET
jgi:hypothetical protein